MHKLFLNGLLRTNNDEFVKKIPFISKLQNELDRNSSQRKLHNY